MWATDDDVARVLGIARRKGRQSSRLRMVDDIQRGFPVGALHSISNYLAPDDANFKFQIVSKATLARRKKRPGSRLTADESDRLVRLARVWSFATEVWGDDDGARAFLFRAHPILSGRRPIDVVLGTDSGARLVEEILGRLKYGSAA